MTTLGLLSLLVTAAALFGWVSVRWLKLPITIGVMLLTVGAAVCLLGVSGAAPGLREGAVQLVGQLDFQPLFLHGMLGVLLFAGAFLLDLKNLAAERTAVGALSLVGTLLATAATTGLMYGVARLAGVQASWLECMFFGALISPTDPIAVLEMLRRVGAPKWVEAILAGESLFNDGVGAVLFLAVLDVAQGGTPSPGRIGLMLVLKSGGGLLLGVVLAKAASELMVRVNAYQIEILLTLAVALGGYALAERMNVSAPLEAVAAGIAMRYFNAKPPSHLISHESIDRFWEVVDEVQNAVLFVLMGLEVLALPRSWGAIRAGVGAIVAVTLVRVVTVALVMGGVRKLQGKGDTALLVLSWGGLRGGLALALAMSVPEANGRAWIVTATYVVVLFSVAVQGGTMNSFLRRTKAL